MTKILIVDDAIIARMVIQQCATALGYQVVGSAETGATAIALFKEHAPDIVVLDLGLDDLDGLEVLQQMKAQQPGVRVIVYSANRLPEAIARAEQLGAAAFLHKPLRPADLKTALAEAAGA